MHEKNLELGRRARGASEIVQSVLDLESLSFLSVWGNVQSALGIGSQAELARILGVSKSAITKAKKRGHFPLYWVHQLADKFNTSAGHVITGDSQHKKKSESTECFIYRNILERSISDAEEHHGVKLSQVERDAVFVLLNEEVLKTVKDYSRLLSVWMVENYKLKKEDSR